jgi:hypothetical protein
MTITAAWGSIREPRALGKDLLTALAGIRGERSVRLNRDSLYLLERTLYCFGISFGWTSRVVVGIQSAVEYWGIR